MAKVFKTLKKKAQATPIVGVILDSLKSENPRQNAPSIQAVLDNLQPKQLLINPDFQINQRGKTQYVSSTVPILTVDMWGTNLLTIDVLENGIKITNNDTIRHSIYQKGLALPKGDYTIVINVLEKTGTLSTQPFEILYYDEGGQVKYAKEIENIGLTTVSFNDSVNQVTVAVPPNCTLTLEYIDLFEGDIAYPHVKKSYQDDSMECQFYVKPIKNVVVAKINQDVNGNSYFTGIFFGKMASVPNVLNLTTTTEGLSQPHIGNISDCSIAYFYAAGTTSDEMSVDLLLSCESL